MAQKPRTLAGAISVRQAQRYGVKFGQRNGDRIPITSPGDPSAINAHIYVEPIHPRIGEKQWQYVTGIRITQRNEPAQRVTIIL